MSIDREKLSELVSGIDEGFSFYEHRDQLTVNVSKDKLPDLCLALRDSPEFAFDMLLDITAIDWLRAGNRFETVYFLWSNKFKTRLRLKSEIDGKNPLCPSVTGIWESANWYERETFDMYGIVFEGHPNLRRFYMPDDYFDPESGEPIYPLRKDFPLMGIPDSLPLPPYPEKYGELK